MTDKQFEQIEYLSKKLWGDINNGHEYSMVTYTEFLGIVTEVWERLQEEPVSEDLEQAIDTYLATYWGGEKEKQDWPYLKKMAIHFAEWQKEHLWEPADGDDLPEINKEVIALIEAFGHYKVIFAHRVDENAEIHNSIDGKPLVLHPKRYNKGGWNIPVVYWLDVELPKEIGL